jgi:hypothetical protein
MTAAKLLGGHAVALQSASSTPPTRRLGIWIAARRVVLVEQAPTGRRLYLELRRGVPYRANLIGLAQTL